MAAAAMAGRPALCAPASLWADLGTGTAAVALGLATLLPPSCTVNPAPTCACPAFYKKATCSSQILRHTIVREFPFSWFRSSMKHCAITMA